MLASAACRFDGRKNEGLTPTPTETAAPAPGTFVLGSSVTPAGAVPADAAGEMFVRGGPLYLSIAVTGASHPQEIRVEWIDPDGRVFHRDARAVPQTVDYAAFTPGSTSNLKPGTYRVAIIIDGRRVNEQPFTVA